MTPTPTLTIRGFKVFKGFLRPDEQVKMVEDLRVVVKRAPLFSPVTSSGKKMSVRMTSAGKFGWVSDQSGYRYEPRHPTGVEWPQIPDSVKTVWENVTQFNRMAECCLVNFYSETAKMGMHQDRDEQNFDAPVVSISLGDEALFRMGNTTRGGKTESLWVQSGDVVVMGGDARLAYHGIDRVKFGTSQLLQNGGRINVTLRVVT